MIEFFVVSICLNKIQTSVINFQLVTKCLKNEDQSNNLTPTDDKAAIVQEG